MRLVPPPPPTSTRPGSGCRPVVDDSEAGTVRGEGGAVVEVQGAWSAAADRESGDAPETVPEGAGRTPGIS
ncbi:hypothetical protein Pmani_000448 [Petrolisthes manimaculis]|uniref:Uncharacterized protein n=1 Tax=Petrolisthes manimaculis TaxID=1843537 RepID=A0AAE1QM22_9EUCA|nr:hypothetical protein Pmani_000448 [Petrolisthes manimaculis]